MPIYTASGIVKSRLLQIPRPIKRLIAVVSDVLIGAAATALAMDLRVEQMLEWSPTAG